MPETTMAHIRRARQLQYATIGWNVSESAITIALGLAAGSVALIGFGTDSMIEVFASLVALWHIGGDDAPHRTRRALRLVAAAFVVLAVLLGTAAIRDLVSGREAEESVWGIAYLGLTALVMYGLALAKLRVAARVGSAPLRSEASLTFLDGTLALLTLVGLGLNAWLGWWWADPAAGLIVGAACVREGFESWREGDEVMEAG